MTDRVPSTPRPQLRLLPPLADGSGHTTQAWSEPPASLADTEPDLGGLAHLAFSSRQDALNVVCTLVRQVHARLNQVARGPGRVPAEWRAARTVLESAVRHLVLAQTQSVLTDDVPYRRASGGGVLDAVRRLCQLARLGGPNQEVHSDQVWAVAVRLDLAAQCLADWTAKSGHGVSAEEVGALAQELDYTYQGLVALGAERK